MKSFTFKYQGRMPALNDYIKANRGKGGKFFGNQTKKFLTNDMAEQIKKQSPIKFTGLVVVEFHWVEINKMRDPDNFVFAKKFVLDGLVLAGVLPNDGWNNI